MTNLIRNKKFTRITALLLAVAVIFGTMFTFPVSAASGDKVTITFDYCYDSTGNIIKFQQTTVSDGYTVGTPGEELCKIFADGKEAYCIEPGHTLYSGNTLTEDGSTVWKNLGSAKQKAINLALLYGKPGSGKSLSGTEDQKWVATQLIVWEFVSGCRSTSEGYKCTNTKFIDGICVGGANPGVKSVYNAISKSLANYSTVPSFASAIASKAETYEMKYSDGKYTLTLTDSNSILSDFSFKTTSGISVSQSGNKLTLTSSTPVNDLVTFNSAKSMPSVSSTTLVPYGDASLQDIITGVENDADPIRAYFKVKTSLGNLKLVKTSEDGNVANIEFTVKGDGYSKTVKTNSKGEFELTDLVPGSYTVTEITDSKYETQKSQTVKVESGKTATVKFENVLKKGSLEVVKTSEDNFNEGVKFHLYGTSLSGASVDLYATTNADGIAKFENVLVSGDTPYTLEEVDTADRYVVPKAQTASIEWNKVTQRSFENVLKKWNLSVTKVDSETKTAQGDATLAGAIYGIYDNGKLVDKYTTDKNGSFTTFYYVCGDKWTLKEIEPSEGYLLDETEYHIGADAKKYTLENNSISMGVTEDILKGKISIIKHTDDGSTKIETPEKGAEFQVYLKSAGGYSKAKDTERDILTCDEYGFAETKDLQYGIYTVHQSKGWNGTEFIADFDVFVSENNKTYKYLINNASLESYVKIVKIDSETGKQIPYAGAGFRIYNSDGKLVTMKYTYPTVTEIDTFYTNSEGYLITPETLPYGKGYSVVEVQAPYGYILDSTPVYFDITAENTSEENGVTIVKAEKKNTPQKSTITVEKTGEIFSNVTLSGEKVVFYQPEYSVNGLAGAVFEIYADEDITTPDGTVRAKKDELVATLKTNSKGTATSKQLYLGKYRVVEKAAPNGFVLNRTVNHIELTYSGQNEKVTNTSTSFTNDRQKAEIDLTKVLEQNEKFNIGNNDEILNVSFGLYADEDLKAANGTVIPKDGLLEIITCDEKGKATFTTDLPIGSYYVKEISTDSHYILSDKKYPVVFEYAGQNTATVHISVNDGEPIENEIIYGTIKGLKIDRETGENIAGALFGLFSTDETEFTEETAILTAESNEGGIFEFTNVPYGEYIIRELKPAEGYLPNEENYTVKVSENDEIIEITVENDKTPELGTTATIDGKKEVGATEVFTLEDVVEYKHLVPGKEYTVKGILMDKTTGDPLLIDEKEIPSETTFTPDEPSGEVLVSFEFDARYIKKDTDIVVFESLYSEDKELAVHADIEDVGQTVTVKIPKIGTKASIDGKKEFTANGDITIDDVVSYKNLTVGKEYTISGVLMDKATGKPFLVDGKEVYSEVTFTPETADGEVTVSFTFDGSAITKDTEIVVFETLYREGTEIAVHADIDDKDQTVTIHPQPEPEKPQTGDNSNLGFYIGLGSVAVGGLIAFLIIKFKKKDEDDE
ncbi:SpaA isopeptide-forming pilin-related protein [uncultured Ruminococcus sp.]|uniref:SpaA isopeptide-forming pilin-related protein n=1 Tax=uncultured Ruminococcus sp. TaxID=165186 RepID=UPI0025D82672|nr:SpaA isopeptide-forming pilin-related protein [uncultured Ruminococcus sp.]